MFFYDRFCEMCNIGFVSLENVAWLGTFFATCNFSTNWVLLQFHGRDQ